MAMMGDGLTNGRGVSTVTDYYGDRMVTMTASGGEWKVVKDSPIEERLDNIEKALLLIMEKLDEIAISAASHSEEE